MAVPGLVLAEYAGTLRTFHRHVVLLSTEGHVNWRSELLSKPAIMCLASIELWLRRVMLPIRSIIFVNALGVMKAWRRAMDAVASASLDALLEDFAGSDQGLSAIIARFRVLSILVLSQQRRAGLSTSHCKVHFASRCMHMLVGYDIYNHRGEACEHFAEYLATF